MKTTINISLNFEVDSVLMNKEIEEQVRRAIVRYILIATIPLAPNMIVKKDELNSMYFD